LLKVAPSGSCFALVFSAKVAPFKSRQD